MATRGGFNPAVEAEQRKVKPAKQRPWRDVKEEMKYNRFTHLRKLHFDCQTIPRPSWEELMKEAEEYALTSVRNAAKKAIAQELGES